MYISVTEYPSGSNAAILASTVQSVKYFRSDVSEIIKSTGHAIFAYGTVEEIHLKIKLTEGVLVYGGWLGGV